MSKTLGIVGQLKLQSSLEEIIDTVQVEENYRPERLVEDNEVEREIIETQDRLQEVDQAETNLELADRGLKSLESLTETLKIFEAKGGMNANTAILFNHTYDNILRSNFGYTPSQEDYLSLESFTKPSQRTTSTTIALEDVKTTTKQLLSSAFEAIKKLIESAIKAVKSFFSITKALVKRAKKLKDDLIGIKNFKFMPVQGSKEIATAEKLNKWGTKICSISSIGGTPKANSVLSACKEARDFVEKMAEGSFLKDIGAKTDEVLNVAKKVASKDESFINKYFIYGERALTKGDSETNFLTRALFGTETSSNKVKKLFDKGGKGHYYDLNKYMPGGYALIGCLVNEGQNSYGFTLPTLSIRYVKVTSGEGSVSLKSSHLPKDIDSVRDIYDAVIKNMQYQDKAVEKTDSYLTKMKSTLNDLRSTLSSLDGSASNNNKGTQILSSLNTFKNRLFSFFKSIISNISTPISRVYAHSISIHKLALEVCSTLLSSNPIPKNK